MDLSAEHLIAVGVTFVSIVVLVFAARTRPGRWVDFMAAALAVLIIGNESGWWAWELARGKFSVAYDLPLFPCDIAGFAAVIALWRRTPILVELTYFWGIAGTVNGVITPDIGDHFPSYPYFQYYFQHGAIPAAALFLVIGLKIYPRPWATLRMLGLGLVLLVVDALANALTDGNYFFLRSVPPGVNLLDLFGPWPWYIAGGILLGVVLFGLLELPFRIAGPSRARSRTSPYPRSASQPSPLPPRDH